MEEKKYLANTKAPVQLLGLTPLLNPFADKVSAQRGMMFSGHAPQAQIVDGCEHPRIFTGYESIVGEYEYNTTERGQDIQVLDTIPKFIVNSGAFPIKENPLYTIVYRGEDGKVSYFQLEKFTMRSAGYGYKNKWLNTSQLNKGNYIPKDTPLCTSPAHMGNMYALGTNLNTCYMSIPQVTEDAFVISETAAKKLSSWGYDKISFKILPNQIPRNLYGNEEEYCFMPDIGDYVRDDGILVALMQPTADSIVTDMSKEKISKVQYLHDDIFYAPKGSQVVDIDVVVNRKCKVKTPKEVFSQVQKYRDPINAYNIKVWESYQNAVKNGHEISPAFNTLVTRCVSSLLADNVRIPGFSKKADVTLVKKKETIEFIYVTVTIRYPHTLNRGYKQSGRFGNKGVCCVIVPDENMPIDEQGIRADVICDPIAVFNRMNPGQLMDQYICRCNTIIHQRLLSMYHAVPENAPKPWDQMFSLLMEYINDISPQWAELLTELHTGYERTLFLKDVLEKGIFMQINPFQKNITTELIEFLAEKYQVESSPVTFKMPDAEGKLRTIKTKKPVMIGEEYWYSLYKIPHMRCSGMGYVNQYHSPVRASSLAKMQFPFAQTPIRLGEDEIRNITMTAGQDTAARILGTYANSPTAVNKIAEHLLFDAHPSKLEQIDMTTREIIESNCIIGVARHIFSSAGVDITGSTKRMKEEDRGNLVLPANHK